MTFLTWKTLFLTLLASGSRRGEIHAIKAQGVRVAEDGSHVSLIPDPEFIPKAGLKRPDVLKTIRIYALGTDQAPGDGNRSLCPVRCIEEYKKRTKDKRKDKKLFFVHTQAGRKGEVHKNTLSSWIRQLLLFCYKNPSENAAELLGTRTHEIRGLAHTLSYVGMSSMEHILQAGSWKNHSTFTSAYLKDLTEIDTELLHRIGPLSAGQRVVRYEKN